MKSYLTKDQQLQKITAAIKELIEFLKITNFQGWEPYDILNHHWMSILRSRALRVLLTQTIRISPIFVHPHVKEKMHYSKATALFAQVFLILFQISKNINYRDQAIFFLNWLEQHRSLKTKNFSIGAQYDLNMKNYGSSADTPSPFITALAIEAFISAYETLGVDRYLEIAASGTQFFLEELPQITVTADQSYFIYHPNNLNFIPNLPAIISGTLARFYSISGNEVVLKTILNNLRYVVHWQRPDGAWFYSPTTKYSDSFHTAFILEALARFEHYVKDQQFNSSFLKGLAYYEKNFFTKDVRPIHKKLYGLPKNADALFTSIDLRDSAQAIVLFSFLIQQQNYPDGLALNLANWSIDHFRSPDGYFYYQQLPIYVIKNPFISMQAWMLYALCRLLTALSKDKIGTAEDGSIK